MGRKRLGDFEREVLFAVAHLRGRGYGVTIADEVERISHRRISLGAVYATLDRLERKKMVSSKLGEATPERGGKPKRHYQIEAPGERALSEARAAAERMWGAPLGARA
jgi:PadR family transcriptional regulator, regulatory protein PadR